MRAAIKLATGLALTGLVADAAYNYQAQAIIAHLGRRVAPVLLAHQVTDASGSFVTPGGWTWRRVRLRGTADAATRAAVVAEVAALPGIAGASFEPR